MIQVQYRGSVAFFYPWGNLGAFSSLRDTLNLFVENGYWVDFYTQKDPSFPPSDKIIPGVSIIDRPEAFVLLDLLLPKVLLQLRKGSRPYHWIMLNFFLPILRELKFKKFIQQRHRAIRYSCMIGMDPEGLISASLFGKLLKVPYIYWSLELLIRKEIKAKKKENIKNLEIGSCKEAALTIVQDRWRGQVLAEENGQDPANMVYVPVAPRGKARRQKSDYLHKRLNIPLDRKIILCAGSISSWAMNAEIAAAAAHWTDEYILVMQSRSYKTSSRDQYLERVSGLAKPGKVIISFDPVPQSEYRDFVDSADVGIAFYVPGDWRTSTTVGENIRFIGLSSGKIASYLSSGLPVVVNDAVTGPKELVQSSSSGICVKEAGQIKGALEVIFDRYDEFVKNACACFDQKLELEEHLIPVIRRIDDWQRRLNNNG